MRPILLADGDTSGLILSVARSRTSQVTPRICIATPRWETFFIGLRLDTLLLSWFSGMGRRLIKSLNAQCNRIIHTQQTRENRLGKADALVSLIHLEE